MSKPKEPLVIISCIALIAGMLLSTLYCIYIVNSNKNIISQLEYDNSGLQAEIEELQTELKETKSDLNKAESNLKIINARIKTAESALSNKESELKNAQSALTNARTDAAYWKDKYMATDPANVTYSYEFSSVNALITAIKKNPEAYHNVKVKVYGMILAYEDATFGRKAIALMDYKGESLSFDSSDYEARYFMRKKAETKELLEVTLSSDLQYTVAETGDYVNIYGIVKITNGEIYLDKCQYN